MARSGGDAVARRRLPAAAMALLLVATSLATVDVGVFGEGSVGEADLLLTSVDDVVSLAMMDDLLLAGTLGGGVAELTADGRLASLSTTVEGLPSSHVRELAVAGGDAWAATRSGLAHREGVGDWSVHAASRGTAFDRVRSDGSWFVALADNGSLLMTEGSEDWVPLGLTPYLPLDGWTAVDNDGDRLAVAEGRNVSVVDLATEGMVNVTAAARVLDLDLSGSLLAVAMDDHPDAYDLDSHEWLGGARADQVASMGSGWRTVRLADDGLWAGSADGAVARIPFPLNASDWSLAGELEATGGGALPVRDLLPRGEGVLVATPEGVFGLEEGIPSRLFDQLPSPPSSDVRSVSMAAGIMWTLTDGHLDGLTFDSYGRPDSWLEGVELPGAGGVLDTGEVESTVYMAGAGEGVRSYDTFASSKPSRWGVHHTPATDGADGDVRSLAVVEGTALYTGGPYGLDRMERDGDDIGWSEVPGGPGEVLSLAAIGEVLLVGSSDGLWSFSDLIGWKEVTLDGGPLPAGNVSAVLASQGWVVLAVGGEVYWGVLDWSAYWEGAVALDDVSSATVSAIIAVEALAGPTNGTGPVWCVAGERGLALDLATGEMQASPGGDGMGDAVVRDAEAGPGGVSYLATDSGVHRIGPYETEWRHWTTSNGLSANDLRDLEVRPGTDELWVAAYGGVDILDTTTGTATRVGMEDGLPSNQVYDVAFRGEELWVGTDVGGAGRRTLPDGPWATYNASTGLAADDVEALAFSGDTVYFGTDAGVTVLDEGSSTYQTYTRSSTGGGLAGDWVHCALAEGDGVYVGTDRGLSLHEGGSWDQPIMEGRTELTVRALVVDGSGRLWVGHDEGLIIMTTADGVFKDLDREDGLPGGEVLSLMLDSEGWMWVGTSAGAAMVDMDGRVHATFTTRDGLVHDRVTSLEEHPAGTVWLGTAGGLSRLRRDRWDTLPQWRSVGLDLPDVFVSLSDVRAVPEVPTIGEEVVVNVTVRNPSARRAIVTVELALDDGGAPGTSIGTAIAYTEPGGSYSVKLPWTVVGGDHVLWVVLDPLDLVPETDEGNNLVAVNLHVNRPPSLEGGKFQLASVAGEHGNQTATLDVSVVYSDPDSDVPALIRATETAVTEPVNLTRVVGSGDNVAGVTYRGSLVVPVADIMLVFEASDGHAYCSTAVRAPVDLRVALEGVERGEELSGEVELAVRVIEPWLGDGVDELSVALVNGSAGMARHEAWAGGLELEVERVGLNLTVDVSGVEPGEYELWVLAIDDRGVAGFTDPVDVTVARPEVDEGEWPTMLWALAFVVAILIVAVAVFTRK